eukprot:6896821-Pyramimonas_sp.AAC.1
MPPAQPGLARPELGAARFAVFPFASARPALACTAFDSSSRARVPNKVPPPAHPETMSRRVE